MQAVIPKTADGVEFPKSFKKKGEIQMLQEKRQKLRDASMCLLIFIALDLFNLVGNVIVRFFDGSIEKAMGQVDDPAVLLAVQISLAVIAALEIGLIVAQTLIGVKGFKISQKPTAEKGYIVGAKVFLILTAVSLIAAVVSLFDSQNIDVIDTVLSLVRIVLDILAYILFIKSAEELRVAALEEA